MTRIRRFSGSDEDYRAAVDIHNAAWPDSPTRAAHWQRIDRLRLQEHMFRRLLVDLTEGGSDQERSVAFASYGHMPWSYHPHKFYLEISVHPDFRCRGIGSALYEHVLAALQPHQPLSVDASTREDQAEGRRFLEGRGFGLASRAPASQLNPASFDPGPYAQTAERLADEGVAIQTLAELAASDPGYLRKLYDLECEAAQDLPWHDRFTPQPYEQYILSYRDNPDLMPDGYMVALERGQVVGMTQLWRSQATDAILYTGLTAVRRTHRRRGIATAIKAQAIGYAKTLVTSQGGPPMIRTENEESNPMFRLNLRLGFRERPAWLVYRKEL